MRGQIKILEAELREKEHSEKLLNAVYRISELTNDVSVEINDFYKKLRDIVGELIDVTNFYICKLDSSGRNIDFVFYRDSQYGDERATAHPSRKVSDGFTELVIRSKETMLLSRSDMEKLCTQGVTKRRVGISESWLGVPLFQSENLIGVIVVQSYIKGFMYSEADVQLLTFVSQHVSTAIRRRDFAEQERQQRTALEFAANHDELTGLPNRTAIYSLIEKELDNTESRKRRGFSVMFVDLDGFKQVNDSYGHQVGDCLLQVVAKKLNSIVRENDKIGRIGGDEFIILLNEMSANELAFEIANRVINEFARPLMIKGCEVSIGVSIGIAHSCSGFQSVDEMISAADNAMYKAKALGKNNYQETA
nr:sensor domain-containing diguanylate cyclase [Alteromonas ponticola]